MSLHRSIVTGAVGVCGIWQRSAIGRTGEGSGGGGEEGGNVLADCTCNSS